MHLTSHRPPSAGTDPIDAHESALRTVVGLAHLPPRDETIVVFLDDARRGITVVNVTGTVHPDAVVEVVELITSPAVHGGRVAGIVVASIRTTPDDAATAERDVDRWLEISELADDHAVELVEWYVIGPDGASCPRDRLGEPPRW
jgi:hypothetical protein